MPTITREQQLVEEEQRIPFAGLTPKDDADLPEDVARNRHFTGDVKSFKEVIELLPEASRGELEAINQFVNEDGTVDTAAIEGVDDIDLDSLDIDADSITDADRHVPVNDYVDIVDDRRKALNAIGYDTKFRWQIATDSYTIINPKEAYFPAQRSFRRKGESETIFGWVDYQDWGGKVDIYILFREQTVPHPYVDPVDDEDADADTDGEDDEDDRYIYVGVQTGYDFSGGRALDAQRFGYDADRSVRLYNLGRRRSRRHVGDPNNASNERKNGRVPIKDWWDQEYDNILNATDELAQSIQEATSITLDFSSLDYSAKDFYEYLDIPEDYAEVAQKRAMRHSPAARVATMWAMYLGLTSTLETDYQGQDHTSATFEVYAEIARDILRHPHRQIDVVQEEHRRAQEEGDDSSSQLIIDESQQTFATDDISDIEGVGTEDQLGLADKRDLTKNAETQKGLHDF